VSHSYVVAGGGRGVDRAIAERLAADGGTVVIIERDEAALDWVPGHPAAGRLSWVTGSAADEWVAETAAERAEVAAPLAGWVNNAARFRDAALHTAPPSTGRNQFFSTSAMCLTMPSRDRLDGGTARSRSWSSVSPSHFRARVARCHSRNAVRVARSSASVGGVVRGGVTGPP
jgi:NAD(P)-dependent dehydrogenase (short-subunit alcohol dehydrogenase family)